MRRTGLYSVCAALGGLLPALVQAAPLVVDDHFAKGHERFVARDMRAAAEQVRVSSAWLGRESRGATAEGKKALQTSAGDLGALARDVDQGVVASVKELDQAFARAHYALAFHFFCEASKSLAQHAPGKVARELKAAAAHAERALAWGRERLGTGSQAGLKAGYEMADQARRGLSIGTAQAQKALAQVGHSVDEVGGKVGASIDLCLKQARESFDNRDMAFAAAEVRFAGALVTAEAELASGDAKKALEDSGKELTGLALEVRRGTVQTAQALEQAFSRARQALARNR